MRNQDKWQPSKFKKDARGRFLGTHMHQAIGPVYERIVSQYSSGRLLDVGCGDVPLYYLYKDKTNEVVCTDWQASGPDSHLDFEHDLTQPLPLADQSFDTVLCTDVLEHIPNPHRLFSEMSRVLKPGGTLIITTPFYYWLHDVPHDHHRYTSFAYEYYCRENGLEIKELDAYGGVPEIIVDVIYKSYSYLNLPMKRTVTGIWGGFGKWLLRRGWVKKLSRASSKNFPLGYYLVAFKNKPL